MAGFDPLTAILNVGNTVIDRLLPDKAANDAAKAQLATMAAQGQLKQQADEMALAMKVNDTMQAEAASPHWLQWAWRPIIGLVLGALVINNYILLPYCQGFGLRVIDVPDRVWEVLLAVVGVSALTRGAEKVAAVFQTVKGSS